MRKICLLFGILFLLSLISVQAKENLLYDASQTEQKKASVEEEADWAPYMRELQRRIKNNWKPPRDPYVSNSVVLMFKISKDGRLLSNSIHKSSGSEKYDKAAVDALIAAAPFRPLPSEYKKESVEIQFTFDYRVFGDSRRRYSNSESAIKVLEDNFYVTNKDLIITRYGYKFVNAIKISKNSSALLQCKVDCKNKQIGVKKSYFSSAENVIKDINSILQSDFIFYQNVKMQPVDKNQDYLNIYNYVCEP